MNVLNIIDSEAKLRPRFAEIVSAEFTEEEHPKGKFLWREGSICPKLYVVREGFLRSFYYNKDGKDISHWFAPENNVITDMGSFFQRRPSEYNMETIEDSVVYTISLDRLNRLFEAHHEIETFGRLFTMEMMVQMSEKVKDLQFRTGIERYKLLLEKHPSIIQRAPLGKIASYLGITQQSLSRIRAQR